MGTVGQTQLWGKAGKTDAPQLGEVHSCQKRAKRFREFCLTVSEGEGQADGLKQSQLLGEDSCRESAVPCCAMWQTAFGPFMPESTRHDVLRYGSKTAKHEGCFQRPEG